MPSGCMSACVAYLVNNVYIAFCYSLLLLLVYIVLTKHSLGLFHPNFDGGEGGHHTTGQTITSFVGQIQVYV